MLIARYWVGGPSSSRRWFLTLTAGSGLAALAGCTSTLSNVLHPGQTAVDSTTVGPHPGKTDGSTDEFAVQWQGDPPGHQVVTGSCSTRRDDGDERGFQWTVHLTARTR